MKTQLAQQGVAAKYPMASGGLRHPDFADRGIVNGGEDFHPRNAPLFHSPATRLVQEEETGDEQ